MIRVADYIMNKIHEAGVNHLFYVPGGQCVYLVDALRRSENIKGISTHHEQAAAMAALSYSQYNGKMGACLVTTGCAGTNTMTGLLHAWQDSIPCVFVSGQQNVQHTIRGVDLPLRQVGVQEADITTIVEPITKYAVTLMDVNQVVYEVEKALYLAQAGRRGPVWLDVPLNIQNAMIDEDKLEHYVPNEDEELVVKSEDLNYIKECMNQSLRPVLLVGQGVRSAGAVESFLTFAKTTQIPVTTTRAASDYMDYNHPLNVGISVSTGGERGANFAVQNSDLLITIGCRLSVDTVGGNPADYAREAKVIVIDIDEVEHSKPGVTIDRFIHADAKAFLEALNSMELKKTDAWWIEKCQHWKKLFRPCDVSAKEKELIDICYFMETVSEKMPKQVVTLCDAGNTGVAAASCCHLREGDRFVHSIAQGEMGFSLPGAMGVACAHDGMVLAFTGDGSFMMNLQELQTLVRNQWNIKVMIVNNNGYSGVRHGQKAHFRGKSLGTDSSNGVDFPDYGKVAEAFGIDYVKINNTAELEDKLVQVFATDKPVICEAMCDPDQFLLHSGLVKYGKRKFGFRPIEDQSPFLDREVFFEEMIIEPMETSYGEPV